MRGDLLENALICSTENVIHLSINEKKSMEHFNETLF